MTDFRTADGERKPVGTILREAREGRSLSLDDAARVTRIGKTYLNALEEGMFERLPSAVYVRGFLRIYTAYLNLPEEEILRAYETGLTDTPAGRTTQEVRNAKKRSNAFSLPSARFPVMILSLAAAALFAWYLFFAASGGNDGKTTRPAAVSTVEKSPEPQVAPELASDTAPVVRKEEPQESGAAENAEQPLGELPPVVRGLALKIKVVEDGWLDITIDDTISQHYELKAGDLIEWKGEKGFTIDVGNAGGIEAELNGRMLKPFGRSGETAHVTLSGADARP